MFFAWKIKWALTGRWDPQARWAPVLFFARKTQWFSHIILKENICEFPAVYHRRNNYFILRNSICFSNCLSLHLSYHISCDIFQLSRSVNRVIWFLDSYHLIFWFVILVWFALYKNLRLPQLCTQPNIYTIARTVHCPPSDLDKYVDSSCILIHFS